MIGAAASHIPEEVESAHPEVPWHLMRAMGNRLVHACFAVDPQMVWDTIYLYGSFAGRMQASPAQ